MRKRVVVFDTETTGLSPADEICQIAAVEYSDGNPSATLNLYLASTCEISKEAEEVHGLSAEFLATHGMDPAEAMKQFLRFVGDDVRLVAHNIRFDSRMVRQECEKFGLQAGNTGVEFYDTLRAARRMMPGLKCYSLGMIIEATGIEGANSHDALDDARACAALYFKLQEMGNTSDKGGQYGRIQK